MNLDNIVLSKRSQTQETLSAIFGVWGFAAGVVLILILIASNANVNRRRSYLYPLIPFNLAAMVRLLFRVKKNGDNCK